MKIKLLNNGGFSFLDGVSFPVVVEATGYPHGYACDVEVSELLKIGGDAELAKYYGFEAYTFFTGNECEVLSE